MRTVAKPVQLLILFICGIPSEPYLWYSLFKLISKQQSLSALVVDDKN